MDITFRIESGVTRYHEDEAYLDRVLSFSDYYFHFWVIVGHSEIQYSGRALKQEEAARQAFENFLQGKPVDRFLSINDFFRRDGTYVFKMDHLTKEVQELIAHIWFIKTNGGTVLPEDFKIECSK